MKKTIAILTLLLCCHAATAQHADLYGSGRNVAPTKTMSDWQYRELGVKPPYPRQHEFSIAFGVLATTGDGESIGLRTSPHADPSNEYRNLWWRYDRMGYEVRHGMGAWSCTETFSLGYMYHINRMVHVGGSIAYFGAKEQSFAEQARYRFNSWALAARIRFAWLSRTVKIYTEIGGGIGLGRYSRNKTDIFHTHQWVVDITGLGISIGEDYFWFGEIGWGSRGILRTGIGFRFATRQARERAEAKARRKIAALAD